MAGKKGHGGQKGRSGGARTPRDPAAAKKPGPLIRSNREAPFDVERSRALKILILASGQVYTPEAVRDLLSRQIDALYEDYERPILAAAEAEGLIV